MNKIRKLFEKMEDREVVKKRTLEIKKELKDKHLKYHFENELKNRNISMLDYKRHFENGCCIDTIADDHYYSLLLMEKGVTKEQCDLEWLIQILERVKYLAEYRNEIRHVDAIERFLS
ncbi:hypothetical protein PXQ59_002168 [Vibrio parahaemolyticus]|nr:hypothetical protein [Vibrio parahaemolyticus]